MREITKIQGGNFYYIDKLAIIDECFVDAVGILFSVILKDIEIFVKVNNIAPFTELRVKKTYGDMWGYDEAKGGQKIKTKVFTEGMNKDYICELNLPPCKKVLQDEEMNRVMMTVFMIGNSVENKVIKKQADLLLVLLNPEDAIPAENEANVDVLVNHLRVKGAESIEFAKDFSDQNKFDEAQKLLKDMKKEIDDSPCKDHPALIVLKENIDSCIKLCKPHQYDNSGHSYVTSYSHQHMYQQSNPMTTNSKNVYGTSLQNKMNYNLQNSKK